MKMSYFDFSSSILHTVRMHDDCLELYLSIGPTSLTKEGAVYFFGAVGALTVGQFGREAAEFRVLQKELGPQCLLLVKLMDIVTVEYPDGNFPDASRLYGQIINCCPINTEALWVEKCDEFDCVMFESSSVDFLAICHQVAVEPGQVGV